MGRTREVARRSIHEGNIRRPPITSQPTKRSRPVTVAPSNSESIEVINTYTTSSDSSQYSVNEVQPASATEFVRFTLSDPDVLNCPICIRPLTIPVYQCEDGHFSCQSCRDKIKDKCPTCRKAIGNKRSRGMEKVLESIEMSCENMEHGCMKKISFCKKLDHENSCKFTPDPCPIVGCNYVGAGKSFYDHYVEKHPVSCKFVTFNNVNSVNVGDGLYFLLEEEEKTIFFLHRIIGPLGSFVCVSTAPTAPNMKFSYELTAGSGDMSVNMKSSVLIMPKCFAKPAKEKCLLITNSVYSDASYEVFMLPLQLVIRKVSICTNCKVI